MAWAVVVCVCRTGGMCGGPGALRESLMLPVV